MPHRSPMNRSIHQSLTCLSSLWISLLHTRQLRPIEMVPKLQIWLFQCIFTASLSSAFAAKCLHWSRTEVDSKRELFTEKPALSKSEQFRWNLVQRCKQRPLAPFKSRSSNTKAPQFSKQKFQIRKAMKALVAYQRSWQLMTGWWFDCANFSCEAFDKPVESGTSPAMACLLSSSQKNQSRKCKTLLAISFRNSLKCKRLQEWKRHKSTCHNGSRFQISPVF